MYHRYVLYDYISIFILLLISNFKKTIMDLFLKMNNLYRRYGYNKLLFFFFSRKIFIVLGYRSTSDEIQSYAPIRLSK